MHLRPPNSISESERIRLIGELICKAILRSSALSMESDGFASASGSSVPEKSDRRIVEYLRRAREAAPGEICRMLNLSRTTVHRVLHRLVSERRVVALGGRTSAAAYRLAEIDPSRN